MLRADFLKKTNRMLFVCCMSEFVTSAQFWQLSLLFGRHRFTSQLERAEEVPVRPKRVHVCQVFAQHHHFIKKMNIDQPKESSKSPDIALFFCYSLVVFFIPEDWKNGRTALCETFINPIRPMQPNLNVRKINRGMQSLARMYKHKYHMACRVFRCQMTSILISVKTTEDVKAKSA